MADEKIISPHAFSKFELHVELDGNEFDMKGLEEFRSLLGGV